MKSETFLPEQYYLIKNTGNNFEPLFYEIRNYNYFLKLIHRHLGQIATLESFRFFADQFELIVKIHPAPLIPEKYQDRIHQPFSNLFNAYTKSMNKAYGRNGSLFREHFKRICLNTDQFQRLKTNMETAPIMNQSTTDTFPFK